MAATIDFDAIASLMTGAGYSDEDIHRVRMDFYNAYPKLLNVPFSHAVSTIPNDAPVPLDWGISVLQALEIPFELEDLDIEEEEDEE